MAPCGWLLYEDVTGRRMGSAIDGIGERQFNVPEKSAAWILSLTGKDAMFFYAFTDGVYKIPDFYTLLQP